MSSVTILYNIADKEWSGTEDSITSNHCHLNIGFRSATADVTFDNLSFGFELKKFGETVQSENFPQGPIIYRTTSEPYLSSTPLVLEPQVSYTVSVWAENAGERSTFEYSFSTPDNTDTGEYEGSSVPFFDFEHKDDYIFEEATRTWVKK